MDSPTWERIISFESYGREFSRLSTRISRNLRPPDMTPAFVSATDALERLRAVRVVPVITIDDPADAVPLARALTDGGLACAEITFRTPRAAEALRRITAEVPELFAGVIILAVAGITMTAGFGWLESRLVPWTRD